MSGANTAASTKRDTFRTAMGKKRGYHRAGVDAFLTAARESFESRSGAVTAAHVREVSFPLVKSGYLIRDVDAALARIEDALAARARDDFIAREGAAAWVAQARNDAQVILDHVVRPDREKFDRTGVMGYGYRIDEVDMVAERIARYLRDGGALSVEQLRSAAFRMQRGGYREEQVDALIDATIDVILAIR